MADGSLDKLWILIPAARRASGQWIDDTLKERAREKEMTARIPLAGQFPRQRLEVIRGRDPWSAVNDLFYRRGWTDGLPIVPPTVGKVEQMLARCTLARNQVIAELDPLKGQATAEKIAINAVMAGCAPEYFPAVTAITQAIADPEFNLRGVQTTDENVAPLLIFSGEVVSRLDINSSFGALGPGWRANATIGRAVRLIMHNIGGGWPGAVSLAGLGQAGRYTLCVGENAALNPWEPLHVELGHAPAAGTVTVMRAETAINVTGGLEELASVMGSAASHFSIMHGGKVAIGLAPYVARQCAERGMSKRNVKYWLHEHGRMRTEDWKRSWAFAVMKSVRWPRWVTEAAARGAIPVVESPNDIVLFVAGGDLPIPQNVYFPSWGFPPCRITKEIPAA
ncbi:MAG: hypothetical protein ACREQN_01520 [Candidatus Binataceae bacterium]